jgi:two-component system KDP operon response regulator KdpE
VSGEERKGRILVCDDEPQIVRALKVLLREANFDTIVAETAEQAIDRASVRPPDAAIIDLVLPDGDGIEVTRQLREWSEMPIIVLSAIGEEDEKVRALQAGADDYVTKPFGPKELVARLEAALRRAAPAGEELPVIEAGDLALDVAAHVVRRRGVDVHLTPTEFGLLKALMVNRGRLMTHAALLKDVWGPAYVEDVATLRTHMANLRRKVEPRKGPHRIHTEPGVGYRFTA